MTRVLVALTLALGLSGAGCGEDTRSYDWRIRFASDADRDAAVTVVAALQGGGCGGAPLYAETLRRDEAPTMQTPRLPPGAYGFEATAYDADCRVLASICERIELPTAGATILLELRTVPARPDGCPDGVCTAGVCSGCGEACPDAGHPLDAGRDAGGRDAGDRDAGLDGGDADAGGVDAGRPDAGRPDAGRPDAGSPDAGPAPPDAPVVLSPWNGWASGAANASTTDPFMTDHPRLPEARWEAVDGAMSYVYELAPCDALVAGDCDMSAPPRRVVVDGTTLRARPARYLDVETDTPPLGARWAFRVGACATAGGTVCTYAPTRIIDVGRLKQDVDGDGFGDLFVVGATAGDDRLLRTTSYTLPGTFTTVLEASDVREVAWVGDYDADGFAELAVATDGAPGGQILYLDDLAEAGSDSEDTAGARLGDRIAGVGDVDGDGYADFAVSVPGEGEVRVMMGGPTFNAARSVVLRAPASVTEFGKELSTAGDRDQDGLADVAIAMRSGADQFRVEIYSLAGRVPRRIELEDYATGEVGPVSGTSTSLTGGYDVDDDGVPDHALGLWRLNTVSAVLRDAREGLSTGGGEFGTAIMMGDLVGSGRARIVIGAPGFVDSFGNTGSTLFASRTGDPWFYLRIRYFNLHRFGAEVTVVDYTGDGREDWVSLGGTGESISTGSFDETIGSFGDPSFLVPTGGVSRFVEIAR